MDLIIVRLNTLVQTNHYPCKLSDGRVMNKQFRSRIKGVKETCEKKKGWIRFLGRRAMVPGDMDSSESYDF